MFILLGGTHKHILSLIKQKGAKEIEQSESWVSPFEAMQGFLGFC